MSRLGSHSLYAITIFGYKKEGMSEDAYHDYISQNHAGHLKALLAKNDIVSYTMQHNHSVTNKSLLDKVYGEHLPVNNISDSDAVIQIAFKDVEDYLRVRKDPHFIQVVNPDHHNFADPGKTRFAMGWFEVHVKDGQVVA